MPSTAQPPEFLNVDLELRSRRELGPLLEAFGERVVVLHQDRRGGTFCASLELGSMRASRTVESCVRGFVRLVRGLSPAGRRAWDAASSRQFDVGVRAGWGPENLKLGVSCEALRSVVEVGGELVLTVYPPEAPSGRSRERAEETPAH